METPRKHDIRFLLNADSAVDATGSPAPVVVAPYVPAGRSWVADGSPPRMPPVRYSPARIPPARLPPTRLPPPPPMFVNPDAYAHHLPHALPALFYPRARSSLSFPLPPSPMRYPPRRKLADPRSRALDPDAAKRRYPCEFPGCGCRFKQRGGTLLRVLFFVGAKSNNPNTNIFHYYR